MWMSVLCKPFGEYPAGAMFCVTRYGNIVYAQYLDLGYEPPQIDNKHISLEFSVEDARDLFTKPTRDVKFLMEESIMVCEREYC